VEVIASRRRMTCVQILRLLLDPRILLVLLAHVVLIVGGVMLLRWAARENERVRVARLIRESLPP
jgi:hypothetical protein